LDLTSGYITRAVDRLPKSGSKAPWQLKQNYFVDLRVIRNGKIDHDALQFTRQRVPVEV
jgi:monooxygenase